jgi:pantoate kinase
MSQGSLGAGLCLERGVETIARGIEGDFKLDIKFVEGIGIKNLYRRTLELLSEEITSVREYSWDLAVKLKLPLSQGFGMSASGAISAAMAFQRALGEPNEESLRRAFAIAHRVERELSTGLGDVTALAAGGVERRTSPGSPFSGKLLNRGPGKSEGWTQEIEVVLTWKEDSGKHTSSYIDNQKWKESISSAGIKQMNKLVNGKWEVSRWEELLERSEVFVNESGLLNDSLRLELLNEVDDIIDRLNLNLKPLLCLLGKSLVIVPKEIGAGNVINSESLINHLKDAGFSTVKTKIGKLF